MQIDSNSIKESFVSFIQEVLNTEVKKKDDNYRWCTICVFDDQGNLVRGGYRCDSTRIDTIKREKSRQLLKLTNSATQLHILRFSEIIFKSGRQQPAIFVRGDQRRVPFFESFKPNIFDIDDRLFKEFAQLNNVRSLNQKFISLIKDNNLLLSQAHALFDKVTELYPNGKIQSDKNTDVGTLAFLYWLYLHDTDAHYWIYLPNPKSDNTIIGGAVLCFANELPNHIDKYYENLDCCFELLRTIKELGIKCNSPVASFVTTFYSVKNFYKENWHSFEAKLSKHDPNKLSEDKLYQEKMLVKPHLWRLGINAGVRWLSWFVWRHSYAQGERIDFAIIQKGNSWNINELKERINLFSLVADTFQADFDLISDDTKDRFKGILSLGDIVLQRSIGRKPVILQFRKFGDEGEDLIGSLKRLGFIVCDFSPHFIQPIEHFDTIKTEIVNERIRGAYAIRKKFEVLVGNHTRIKSLKNECYNIFLEFVKQQDSIVTTDYSKTDLKEWLFNYLCWLIAHDPAISAVMFVPMCVRPNIPTGTAWIGLDKDCEKLGLFALRDYLESALLLESYVSESYHPSFPVVYGLSRLYYDLEWLALNARKARGRITVAFIDLNGLKEVNTKFNQYAGSWYLGAFIYGLKKYFEDRQQLEFSKDFSVAVYGGDELVIAFLNKESHGKECCKIKNWLRESIVYIEGKWKELIADQVLTHRTRRGTKYFKEDIVVLAQRIGFTPNSRQVEPVLFAHDLANHIEFQGFCAGIYSSKEGDLAYPLKMIGYAREKEEMQKILSKYYRRARNKSIKECEELLNEALESIPSQSEREKARKAVMCEKNETDEKKKIVTFRIACEFEHDALYGLNRHKGNNAS